MCQGAAQVLPNTGLKTAWDGFGADSPGGLSASALIQMSSSLGSDWSDTGTHKPSILPMAAEAVFNMYSCVCFWMACEFLLHLSALVTQPQTLPRQTHAIHNMWIPEQAPLYETYVYCILKIP